MSDKPVVDPLALWHRAHDAMQEARGCLELGQTKRAAKAARDARDAISELLRSLRPPPKARYDPRQEWLPFARIDAKK